MTSPNHILVFSWKSQAHHMITFNSLDFQLGAKAEGEKTEDEEKGQLLFLPSSLNPWITDFSDWSFKVSISTQCLFYISMSCLACRGQSSSVSVEQVDTEQPGEHHQPSGGSSEGSELSAVLGQVVRGAASVSLRLCGRWVYGSVLLLCLCHVPVLIGSLSYFKGFMPWASTDPQKSKRTPCPWCLRNRKWLIHVPDR